MRHYVIPFFHEDIFTIHTAIVDMIIGVVEQRRRTGHLYFQILETSGERPIQQTRKRAKTWEVSLKGTARTTQ